MDLMFVVRVVAYAEQTLVLVWERLLLTANDSSPNWK